MKQSCTILNFPAEIKVMALLENEKSYEIKITVADLEGKEILYGNGCFTAPSVDSKVTAQCCVCMIPVQNYGTGNVCLKIFHPQNSTVELSEPAFDVENIDERNSIIKGTEIPCGKYELSISIKLANSEIYKLRECIYVYNGCTTDFWNSSGTESLNLCSIMRKEFYVMGKGSACEIFLNSSHVDSEGHEISNGSIAHPFRNIQDAVNVIKAINEISEVSEEFTIYCDGTFEPVNDQPYCGKVLHILKIPKVKIIGIGESKTVLDGKNISGKDSPVVDIDYVSEVFLKNIKITNGNTTGYGGGIVNRGKLILESCEVSDNKALDLESYPDQPRNGGGIFHFGKNLILKNCELKNNMCKNLGSAICCSNSTGDVELDNCVIKNNSAQIGNVTVLVTRSITLNGNVEFDVDDLILFKEKINITANSELSKIKKVKISVENNMYTENEQVLYGNTEDNCQKFLIPDTTWNINSDGILEELRVLTSSPGDNCPRVGISGLKHQVTLIKFENG